MTIRIACFSALKRSLIRIFRPISKENMGIYTKLVGYQLFHQWYKWKSRIPSCNYRCPWFLSFSVNNIVWVRYILYCLANSGAVCEVCVLFWIVADCAKHGSANPEWRPSELDHSPQPVTVYRHWSDLSWLNLLTPDAWRGAITTYVIVISLTRSGFELSTSRFHSEHLTTRLWSGRN